MAVSNTYEDWSKILSELNEAETEHNYCLYQRRYPVRLPKLVDPEKKVVKPQKKALTSPKKLHRRSSKSRRFEEPFIPSKFVVLCILCLSLNATTSLLFVNYNW